MKGFAPKKWKKLAMVDRPLILSSAFAFDCRGLAFEQSGFSSFRPLAAS